MTEWSVIQIYSADYELIKSRALNRYGLELYTPMGKCLPPVKPNPLFKEYKVAFVGYAFIHMTPGWEQILSINSVHGVLMNDDLPVVVRQPVIDKIKRAELFHTFDEKAPVKRSRRSTSIPEAIVTPVIPNAAVKAIPGLPAGTEVFIGAGPFEGQTGIITGELKKGRYAIDIGGKPVKIKFDLLKYLETLQK